MLPRLEARLIHTFNFYNSESLGVAIHGSWEAIAVRRRENGEERRKGVGGLWEVDTCFLTFIFHIFYSLIIILFSY